MKECVNCNHRDIVINDDSFCNSCLDFSYYIPINKEIKENTMENNKKEYGADNITAGGIKMGTNIEIGRLTPTSFITIRDMLINEVIKDKAIVLKESCLKKIDERIDILNNIISGRSDLFKYGFTDIEEAKQKYFSAIELRKKFDVDIYKFSMLTKGYIKEQFEREEIDFPIFFL